jgi:hypothetical protein
MPPKRKVLIFPAGSEIGIEIFHSLKYSHHVEVFGASGKNDHASLLYEPSHYVEDERLYIDAEDFVARLNVYLQRLGIEFIYPTHDSIACFLAERQSLLSAQVITSCAETNRIARYKSETYRVFADFDFCPKVHSTPYSDLAFPVFLKPDDGQGVKGTYRADDAADLSFYLSRFPGLLVTEYLPGDELSVDCFTAFSGELLFVGPRTRERVQMGISFRSTAVKASDDILRIARTLNTTVSLNGAWFFQVKRDILGCWKLLEFAPRQSSTMGLYRHSGVNFALLSLFNALRVPVEILCNDYPLQLDRCLYNRYRADLRYHRVYIDFDETVIAGRHVYGNVMAFLYQCRNAGIEVILITKHRFDLARTLRECAISERLFDRIVLLGDNQEKADFIEPVGAIFIDNHWHDRRAVKMRHGIAVFDVDAVECLLH